MVILELIHADRAPTCVAAACRSRCFGRSAFIRSKSAKRTFTYVSGPRKDLTTLNNFELIARSRTGDVSFKCLPYQLSTVGSMPTVVVTGNGESGFDSGEGA